MLFNFFTDADPTHGFVTYVSESAASEQGLISVRSNEVYMGVDSKAVLNPGGAGRHSVRIEREEHAQYLAQEQTGTLQSANCNNFANPVGVGCGISDPRPNSYGAGFNSNGGGIYAMEWTSSHIRVYFFPAGSAPSDVNGPNPDPSKWGTPVSNFEGSCDIDGHFKDNKFVFDTTFCGDWANAVWSSDGTCAPKAATCTDYVASNPGAFADQLTPSSPSVVAPPPSSRPPIVAPPPSPSAPLVAQPSPVAPQPQNPPAPAVSPISSIAPPIDYPRPQPNNNPLANDNPIFSKISDSIGGIGDTGTPNNLQNLIPTPPALPSVLPAGQLLGIGSGGLPALNTDVNAELDEARDQIQALAKQAVAWKNPDPVDETRAGTEGASHGIVAKPFYPDEAGNGNETAGSAASPTPVLSLGGAESPGVVAFEGGAAAHMLTGRWWVWAVGVVVAGLVMT
ncbi:hypothetical protein EYC84_009001 [Monilinia fructicola]|uniref:GH16 domain-containing protein n=1 Tax=Monilinia fructicola TaxID=38448 RepID=A0A5M9JA30_MONFR|nr:hypothetical protein EYC84_009001 [Monilinia fructicola]